MSTATTGAKPYYFVPQPSHWPILGSCALLLMGTGAAFWFNGYRPGPWVVLAGFCVLLVMLFGWFGKVIGESEGRLYNKKVDLSFRWSMSWFIFTEVMFFAAFFGALFYVRNVSVPDLGGPLTGRMLWPEYAAQWPTVGPYIQQQFSPMGAIGCCVPEALDEKPWFSGMALFRAKAGSAASARPCGSPSTNTSPGARTRPSDAAWRARNTLHCRDKRGCARPSPSMVVTPSPTTRGKILSVIERIWPRGSAG